MHLQVSGIRGDSKSFFVSYMKPYRSVTSGMMSRWIESALTNAGSGPNGLGPTLCQDLLPQPTLM